MTEGASSTLTMLDLLIRESEIAHAEFAAATEGVGQALAWSVLPNEGADYLHTDASILGITLHVASAKAMYGSIAFRDGDRSWREVAEVIEVIEPNWAACLEYQELVHREWMQTIQGLRDADLELEVPHFSGRSWPAWRIIQTVIHHDAYHAGQIAMLRYSVMETDLPPPSTAEDIREHCRDLPHW